MAKRLKQKFPIGTRVWISKDKLGSSMSHFTGDVEAIVLNTYAQEYGGDDVDSYAVYILGNRPGFCAWYYEHQLTKIKGKSGLRYAMKLKDRTGR